MGSDNAIGADNQQERLNDYLAGYVDGEGSFHVAVQQNISTRFKWQLVPEFHVSQNPERASILVLLQKRLGCGRIRANARRGGRDKSLVFVVRNRTDLLEKVIPFFEAHPILSEKRLEFETFASIVKAMGRKEHLTEEGFHRLLNAAIRMNGGGKYRKLDWSSRILRGHMPNTIFDLQPIENDGEDMVRPAWRHAEPGGTETTWPPSSKKLGGNNCVGPYPPRA